MSWKLDELGYYQEDEPELILGVCKHCKEDVINEGLQDKEGNIYCDLNCYLDHINKDIITIDIDGYEHYVYDDYVYEYLSDIVYSNTEVIYKGDC